MKFKKEFILEIIKDLGFYESETNGVYIRKNLEQDWLASNSWQNKLFEISCSPQSCKNYVYFTIYRDFIEFSFSKSKENDYDRMVSYENFVKIFKQKIRNLKLNELL